METAWQTAALMKLRRDFQAAITSERSAITLDSSIAELSGKISDAGFIEPFSIYARGQFRTMNERLGHISTARLNDSPLEVAEAVYQVLRLLDGLDYYMRQSDAAKLRIEAVRSRSPNLTLPKQSGHRGSP